MSACQNSPTTIADDAGVKGAVQLRTLVLSHHPLECVQYSDNMFTHSGSTGPGFYSPFPYFVSYFLERLIVSPQRTLNRPLI